jgi:hypothetical protein
MSVVAGDIKFYLTPTGNADPNLSLGGAGQGSEIGSAIHNIFDRVSPLEAQDGDIEYRAIDVKNTNVADTLYDAVIWISGETTSADTTIDIGLDTTTQTVINESTAPSGVSFSKPITQGTGLVIGDLAPNATKRVWLRRTVTAGASILGSDSGAITVTGGTI